MDRSSIFFPGYCTREKHQAYLMLFYLFRICQGIVSGRNINAKNIYYCEFVSFLDGCHVIYWHIRKKSWSEFRKNLKAVNKAQMPTWAAYTCTMQFRFCGSNLVGPTKQERKRKSDLNLKFVLLEVSNRLKP
jgi:hypothetical protein